MGITIIAKNSEYVFDMDSDGFLNLRKNIAFALDEELGNAYSMLAKSFIDEDYLDNYQLNMNIINEKHLDDKYEDVLNFLYMLETDRKFGYKTCRKIAGLLERRMSELKGKLFRLAAQAGNDYEDFVKFLKDCVRYHRNMQLLRWF